MRVKPRHKPPRRVSDLPRLVVPVGAGLALVLCAVGFVHFTQTALYQQAHFAPGAEHPDDGFAIGFLLVGMAALAALLLSLREPPPMRWRRARRGGTARRTKAKPRTRRQNRDRVRVQ